MTRFTRHFFRSAAACHLFMSGRGASDEKLLPDLVNNGNNVNTEVISCEQLK